jgi:hypothetical protein
MAGTDLTQTLTSTIYGAATAFGISPNGAGLLSTVTDSGISQTSTLPTSYTTGWSTLSCYWRGLCLGALADSFSPIVFVSYSNASGTSPFVIWGIAGVNTTTLRPQWNTAGTQTTGSNISWSPGPQSIGSTFNTTGNVIAYSNGVSLGSTAFGGAGPTAGTGPQFGLNVQTNLNTRVCNGVCDLFLVWNRELSADEMMQVHLAPYDIFLPGEYELATMFLPPPPPFILMPQIVT